MTSTNSSTASSTRKTLAVWLAESSAACWRINADQLRRLRRELPQYDIHNCETASEFKAILPRADVAVVWVFKQEWLEMAPGLEWIATPSAGRDFFKVSRPGLKLSYGSFHGRFMAQTVVGMILAENRGVRASLQAAWEGELWPRARVGSDMRTLDGTHAAIVGFGKIGEWISRYLKAFNVRISGVRRHPELSERPGWFSGDDRVVGLAELDTLLPTVDHLILVVPSGPDSQDMIDARRLALMRPSASIYNVGRGNCIDEGALAAALETGGIASAYLDVFKEEPLPSDNPLRTAPNVLLMPHASAITPEYLDSYLDDLIPQLKAHIP